MENSKNTKSNMRELSTNEVSQVNGGYLGLVLAAAALILNGCANMPRKGEKINPNPNAPF